MTNMSLEDILAELTKYGRPSLHQYSASATPGHKAGGTWGCEVSIPSDWSEADRETRERLDIPVCGWRKWGKGATPTAAATECLAQCMELAESPLAPHAKFISTDMVRGK